MIKKIEKTTKYYISPKTRNNQQQKSALLKTPNKNYNHTLELNLHNGIKLIFDSHRIKLSTNHQKISNFNTFILKYLLYSSTHNENKKEISQIELKCTCGSINISLTNIIETNKKQTFKQLFETIRTNTIQLIQLFIMYLQTNSNRKIPKQLQKFIMKCQCGINKYFWLQTNKCSQNTCSYSISQQNNWIVNIKKQISYANLNVNKNQKNLFKKLEQKILAEIQPSSSSLITKQYGYIDLISVLLRAKSIMKSFYFQYKQQQQQYKQQQQCQQQDINNNKYNKQTKQNILTNYNDVLIIQKLNKNNNFLYDQKQIQINQQSEIKRINSNNALRQKNKYNVTMTQPQVINSKSTNININNNNQYNRKSQRIKTQNPSQTTKMMMTNKQNYKQSNKLRSNINLSKDNKKRYSYSNQKNNRRRIASPNLFHHHNPTNNNNNTLRSSIGCNLLFSNNGKQQAIISRLRLQYRNDRNNVRYISNNDDDMEIKQKKQIRQLLYNDLSLYIGCIGNDIKLNDKQKQVKVKENYQDRQQEVGFDPVQQVIQALQQPIKDIQSSRLNQDKNIRVNGNTPLEILLSNFITHIKTTISKQIDSIGQQLPNIKKYLQKLGIKSQLPLFLLYKKFFYARTSLYSLLLDEDHPMMPIQNLTQWIEIHKEKLFIQFINKIEEQNIVIYQELQKLHKKIQKKYIQNEKNNRNIKIKGILELVIEEEEVYQQFLKQLFLTNFNKYQQILLSAQLVDSKDDIAGIQKYGKIIILAVYDDLLEYSAIVKDIQLYQNGKKQSSPSKILKKQYNILKKIKDILMNN